MSWNPEAYHCKMTEEQQYAAQEADTVCCPACGKVLDEEKILCVDCRYDGDNAFEYFCNDSTVRCSKPFKPAAIKELRSYIKNVSPNLAEEIRQIIIWGGGSV